MKKFIYTLLGLSLVLNSCTDKTDLKKPIEYSEDIWENISIHSTPQASEFPQIYNIEKISKHGKYLLLKNRNKEPMFALIDPVQMQEVTTWGFVGQGPKEFLQTAMIIDGRDEYIRIYDNYKIHKYTLLKDSIHLINTTKCKKEPDFLESIYAIDDSIGCGYKYAPRETGVHILNMISKESFDSISVNEGYFDNKETPYELSFTVFDDKIILGRKRFNQIEVYQINHADKSIKEKFVINYNNASAQKISNEKACYMMDINADKDYFYMLNQDTDQPGQKTYVDIYSWNGKPVKRIILDDLYLQGVLMDKTMYLKKYNDDDHLYHIKVER